MKSNEQALHTVKTQIQFELADAGAEVALAATLSAQAQDRVAVSRRHYASIARELRAAMLQAPINPALLDAMRRLYQEEHRELLDAGARFDAAEQREQKARTSLADLRSRQRSVERALEAVLRKEQAKQDASDGIRIDDLWLQQILRETA